MKRKYPIEGEEIKYPKPGFMSFSDKEIEVLKTYYLMNYVPPICKFYDGKSLILPEDKEILESLREKGLVYLDSTKLTLVGLEVCVYGIGMPDDIGLLAQALMLDALKDSIPSKNKGDKK